MNNYENMKLIAKRMAKVGVKVDRIAGAHLAQELGIEIGEAVSILQPIAILHYGKNINWSSRKDVADLLFNKLGLKSKRLTKGGKPSTSQEALLVLNHPVPDAIRKLRSAVYDIKILDSILGMVGEDGRVHPEYNPYGTVTGRSATSKPAIVNMSWRIKQIFVSDEKTKFLSLDMKQMEPLIMAYLSGSKELVERMKNGFDIYQELADKLGIEREEAKARLFSIRYGNTGYSLQFDLGLTKVEADKVVNQFHSAWPQLAKFHQGICRVAREKGLVSTLDGTTRKFDYNVPKSEHDHLDRCAIATVIQGSAADLIRRAILNVQEVIDKYKIKALISIEAFDEIIIEIDDSVTQQEIDLIIAASIKENLDFPIPLSVVARTGNNLQFDKSEKNAL